MCVIKNPILQRAMRLWNLEEDRWVDSSSFPRQVQHKMASSIQETCTVLAFGRTELFSQMHCNRIPHCGQKDRAPTWCSRLGSSGNRFLISPWPAPSTHWSHGRIQRGCSRRRRSGCSHCEDGSHRRRSSICERGSTGWCTRFRTCQGAWGGSPRIGKRDRWGSGRHTLLFKEREDQYVWIIQKTQAAFEGLPWLS